jgi:hypothetical protein
MDRFFLFAKPKPIDVNPYNIVVMNPLLTAVQNKNILVKGKNFYEIRAVYLKPDNIAMFTDTTLWNPFSGVKRLSAYNAPFFGVKIPFYIYKENHLAFTLPELPKIDGFFDIIIENEAGYGLLSRDSRVPFTSAFSGAIDIQLPCVSGVHAIDILDLMVTFGLVASQNNALILDSYSDEQIQTQYLT